ncbi:MULTISPECIES: UdgX family uracil-DNA binding protein [unclassified Janthinobacterium]|uniref:UdgX family uracil-DNA binding protein n=1 Tax=unclassified Janthinobacterium TaxID=2610881 RepID=UPI001E5F5776|nr:MULTISPECIES: UdgX family uracil-DNA binding protein [unclassified Janthinobacterium]MCC7643128.1 UdgX family uracil-DNA binding protein [Janthinobacterium sp. EB271-G4-3-1]MCC7691575.1 UdgX family uracil-DNA binding protein [Janthinobacterium sp. EB271-G4-3-2]
MSTVVRLAQSFDEWRAAARELIALGVPPADVAWQSRPGDGDLFSATPDATDTGAPQLRLPRQLVELLRTAACFSVPDRWAFLYQVLWRWQLGQYDVMSPADADGARLHAMVKAVHREEHDMHAYVRFRERSEAEEAPRFVAWFEPVHEVLPQVARHFARRMGSTSWMIATPAASMLWDGTILHAGPALMRDAADIDDAGEALWLTYYRSIFNPARVNADLLHSHIPSRFWKNLPEGAIVPAMLSGATNGERRTGQTASVGQRSGAAMIPIAAERVQPAREVATSLDQCRRCELWQHATQAVPGIGPAQARIMLVGEQPGDQEDLAGLPFVGPAGVLLEQAMQEAGMARDSVYLTNAVKHFKWEPRGKRRLHKTPAQREILACHGWLEEEIERVQPQVIVALGSTALKSILRDGAASMAPLIGTTIEHAGRPVVTVYHPAYVLRAPDEPSRRQAYAVIVAGLRQALRLEQDRHHSVVAGTSRPSSRRA